MALQGYRIAGRPLGPGHPVFIIAEVGVNHNGDVARARSLIDAAAAAGADAVKFQTFRAEALATATAAKAAYQREGSGDGSQIDMLRALELDEAAHRELQDHARRSGLVFLSTPFDEASADMLERLDVPAFKVGSGDLTNHGLLGHIADKGRPMLISTGMSTLHEVLAAQAVLLQAAVPLLFLHCSSAYPAPTNELNLRAIRTLAEATGVPVGYSDHTTGDVAAIAATALGACLLEKHITLDRDMAGPDHWASIEPDALAAYVERVRETEAALGSAEKVPGPAESEVMRVARRSLVTARPVRAHAVLGRDDLAVKRPGTGIPPHQFPDVLGRRVVRDLPADTVLGWEDLE